MPVTRISPSDCSTVPRTSEPRAPTRPAASAPVNPSEPGSRDRLTDQVSTAVTTHRDQHRHRGHQDRRAHRRLRVEADDPERRVVHVPELERPQRDGARLVGGAEHARLRGYGPGYWPGYAARVPRRGVPGLRVRLLGGRLGVRLGRGRRLPAGRRRLGRTVVRRLVAAGARGRVGLGSRHPGILSGPPPRHRVSRRRLAWSPDLACSSHAADPATDRNGFGLRRRLCQDSPVAPAGCRGAAVLDH